MYVCVCETNFQNEHNIILYYFQIFIPAVATTVISADTSIEKQHWFAVRIIVDSFNRFILFFFFSCLFSRQKLAKLRLKSRKINLRMKWKKKNSLNKQMKSNWISWTDFNSNLEYRKRLNKYTKAKLFNWIGFFFIFIFFLLSPCIVRQCERMGENEQEIYLYTSVKVKCWLQYD